MSTAELHLLFLPDAVAPRFFLWGSRAEGLELAAAGRPDRARCLTADFKVREVEGKSIALSAALPRLAALSAAQTEHLPPSLAVWSLAAKLAFDFVARGRILPAIEAAPRETQARWNVSLARPDDAERFEKLAKAFPPAAHAVPIEASPARSRPRSARAKRAEAVQVWAPDALLRKFLDVAADTLVRMSQTERAVDKAKRTQQPWERRFLHALSTRQARFTTAGFAERSLLEDLRAWVRPLAGARRDEARAVFRLELPQPDEGAGREPRNGRRPGFTLNYFLQAADDPSLLIPAADVFAARLPLQRRIARNAQERLLSGLASAARLFAPIAASLSEARPQGITLTPSSAWQFLQSAAPQLIEAGLGVILPSELTRAGQRRLRMKMRVSDGRGSASASTASGLTLEGMLDFRWQAELAGEVLDEHELHELATLKAPLVEFRGRWVAVEAAEISEALRLLGQRPGKLSAHEGIAAALGAAPPASATPLPVDVTAEGGFADFMQRLQSAVEIDPQTIEPPATLRGTLRPYQKRGFGWLVTMAWLNLGACLADDMGLGKTVQLIALLLQRQHACVAGATLLVCPTSVVGNWERELQRFAPSLNVVRHYGASRSRDEQAFTALPDSAIVLTTYGLLRRDLPALRNICWSVVALDEAQNIKNASSRTAQAARALQARFRVALTGTPVENRLAELWSIFEFLNPGLLGPEAAFRRDYAIPIERYGQADAAGRLKGIVQPFILRRLKSDPAIIQDLPEKQEMKVICSLTREQASLYQAVLDETMQRIEAAEGIERRGRVLALLTALKQICNHPAQYLHESGPLAGRSGKLQRCIEMLEEVIESGERALVFTQYREMGARLVAEISRVFGIDAPFLHGGVARTARDAMIRRFQEDAHSPPVFVLSVKAGGIGLNLTAASHVFHFDRWWNPAVEDQATDRAYRIGQRRAVQVHKLLCAGTVEEKVDQLLESKRELAARIVGAGERWITELDDAALRDLFSLGPDAVITAPESEEGDNGREGIGSARGRRSSSA